MQFLAGNWQLLAGNLHGGFLKLPIAHEDFSADVHGMAYDNPQFWDETHLESELHRVF